MRNSEQQAVRRGRGAAQMAVMVAAMLACACGSSTPAGQVSFVAPKDGATVKSPVHFEFAAENYTISPVPDGTVEHARDGIGHFHLGVEADCLPSGQAIPKGTPGWVHFGKGDKTIDMQLAPGSHKFSLQAGDDLHRTVAGLCQTISLTVEP